MGKHESHPMNLTLGELVQSRSVQMEATPRAGAALLRGPRAHCGTSSKASE